MLLTLNVTKTPKKHIKLLIIKSFNKESYMSMKILMFITENNVMIFQYV